MKSDVRTACSSISFENQWWARMKFLSWSWCSIESAEKNSVRRVTSLDKCLAQLQSVLCTAADPFFPPSGPHRAVVMRFRTKGDCTDVASLFACDILRPTASMLPHFWLIKNRHSRKIIEDTGNIVRLLQKVLRQIHAQLICCCHVTVSCVKSYMNTSRYR